MKIFAIGTAEKRASEAMLLLRLVAGLSMAFGHGLGKLQNYSTAADSFPDPFGAGSQLSLMLAIGAEFFCGILVAIGLATRFTAIPLIITMATAFFVIHGGDAFGDKEMSLLYMAMFSVIAIIGPGKYSIDNFIKK